MTTASPSARAAHPSRGGAIAVACTRLLLGLMFLVFGLNGIHPFIPAPSLPPLATAFLQLFVRSHFLIFVSAIEIIAGVMLLSNQFVPLALILLGSVLANILAYHVTMQPAGLPLALFATLLWVITALPYRSFFAPLFSRRPPPNRRLGTF